MRNATPAAPTPVAKPGTPPAALLLLGVIHSDPLGYGRTRAFLSEYRPGLVLVELSPFGLAYRREHGSRLHREFLENLRTAAGAAGIDFKAALKHPRITPIRRQISLPFEYRASAAYSAQTGAAVVPVDWSEFSARWVPTWADLISSANLAALLRLEDAPVPVSREYERAARIIRGDRSAVEIWTGGKDVLRREREDHIAGRIRCLLDSHGLERAVYIGGWRHLAAGGGSRTVRDILGIGLPGCFLLDRGPLAS
ncbi:MAG: hypothetical protein WAW37_01890 [Syntrophobacteraceae bacterium]